MEHSYFQSINPYSQEVIETYGVMSDTELDKKIQQSVVAFENWRKTPLQERRAILNKVALALREGKETFATLITLEMGKLLTESIAEIEKCAWVCDYYAENSARFLKKDIIATDAKNSYITHEPLGTIFGIMPWNFPFWQVFRFVAPTLMAGNSILLKHAPNVCGCSVSIEKLLLEAGIPKGVFQQIIISHEQAGKVIAHPHVQGITLTGSDRAGRIVGALAGSNLKKCVLELGGSDPFIILEDADVEMAVKVGVQSRLLNAGQTCISAKRFIVHSTHYDFFIGKFVSEIKKLKKGNPLDEGTGIAPLARKDIAGNLKKQMKQSIDKGAKLIEGGNSEGCWFTPTVLSNVSREMNIFNEETFGPLAAITRFDKDEEAIRIANDTSYGLGASLWTKSETMAVEYAEKINTGSVFINSLVKSDPRLPFGGIKHSGYGRELSLQGIREFVNTKTVYIS